MSVSKWAYSPDRCDGNFCIGDCDWCRTNPDRDSDCDDREDEADV